MLFKVGTGSLAEQAQARIDERLEHIRFALEAGECPCCPERLTAENSHWANCMSALVHDDCHPEHCEDRTECFAEGEPPELD